MKNLSVFLLIITLFFSSSTGLAQKLDDNTIARVGNSFISKDEFLERYELTPMFRKQIKRMEIPLKLEFLYSLVAEKLWALDALEKGYHKTEVIRFSTEMFEKMFVRDALYHQEIKNKVTVSDEELNEGWIKNSAVLYVKFIYSENETEIRQLHNLLIKGVPFDSIITERPEYEEQINPVEVVYGQMAENVEDSLYNLAVGSFSFPIPTPDGYYIFYLLNRRDQMFLLEKDIEEARKTVMKTIRARKESELYREYFSSFFRNKKVDVTSSLMKSLSLKLHQIFLAKKELIGLPENGQLHLNANDIVKMEEEFGPDTLKMEFIKLDEKPLSLGYFIRMLAFDGFSVMDVSLKHIIGMLDSRVKKTIEHELLAREGYRLGLDKSPEVIHSLSMWRDNYLYQFIQSKFLDSVSVNEQELLSHYERNYKGKDFPVQVDIVEILTDSLEVVEYLMQQIDQGARIEDLAPVYTKREWTKEKGGRFGRFSILQHGEIGQIAGKMEVGEIYGPLKVAEGYSIFKLIEKREEYSEPPQPFEKVKDQIKEEISFAKAKLNMIKYTVSLANKYSIQFNSELLVSLPVTSINSFGFRHLGFGGKMTAVPLLAPNVDWVEPWMEGLELYP